jgi:hypothetical protein
MYFLIAALFLWDIFLGYRLYKLIAYPDSTEFLAPDDSDDEDIKLD